LKNKTVKVLGFAIAATLMAVGFQNCGKMAVSGVSENSFSENASSLSLAGIQMAGQESALIIEFGTSDENSSSFDYQLDIKSMQVKYLTPDGRLKVAYTLTSLEQNRISDILSNSVAKKVDSINRAACVNPVVYAVLETNLGSYALGDGPACSSHTDIYQSKEASSPAGLNPFLSQITAIVDELVPSNPTELPEPIIGLPVAPVEPPVIGLPAPPSEPPPVKPPEPVIGLPPPSEPPPVKPPEPVIGLPPPSEPPPVKPPEPVIGLPPPSEPPIVRPRPRPRPKPPVIGIMPPVVGIEAPQPIEPIPVIGLPAPRPEDPLK